MSADRSHPLPPRNPAVAREVAELVERELKHCLDHAAEGLHWVGPDGTILWANQTELDLLGYARDEYIGHNIAEFHVDEPVIDDILARLARGETLLDYEARLRRKDGSVRFVQINSNVLWREDEFLHTRCFTRDVTDRKAADELALRLADIVENSDDAIISHDLHGIVTSWNPAAARLYGYPASEAIGQSISLIIPPGGETEEADVVRRIRKGERVAPFDTLRRHKDGSVLEVSLTISPIRDRDQRIVGASKMARDIRLRKRLEARDRFLVDLDDFIRPLTDAEEITLTAATRLGQHLQANRCAYATVEPDQDTFLLIGNYTSGVESIVGRYTFRQFGDECRRLMRAGQPYVVADVERDARITESDRMSYVATAIRAVICVPILKQARFVAAMAVHTVTPRAWEPDEVELVQRVASRCWESLERARIERERVQLLQSAEAANRAKDEFLAMLGHELRNPLSPILTALQLMRLRGGGDSERELTVIERQVAHLTRLVDDLLDVSRIARGKVELKEEVVQMAEVVATAIEMASPLLEQRTHTLDVGVPMRGLLVRGDSIRLSQVVANLLTNAAKYTPPGGHVSVRAAEEHGEIVLRVRDSGIGIAPDVLPRVFDLFVQEGQAIDRAQGGLGLGLTIVRNLVERHGGTVSAVSAGRGQGSEFIVRLPAVGEAAAENALPADSGEGATGRRSEDRLRILVVDDNVDGAEMLAAALAMKGHETRVAHDGPDALTVAGELHPHIAFLDIGLPVMDGYELAAQFRERSQLQETCLIALTGYGQESDRDRTALAGFHHHLVKPVDLRAVDAVIAAETPRLRKTS
jgi:PAS domain S-box-containing protein